MAYAGIAACHESPDQWFTGVTVCDGAGSPRTGPYTDYSDEEMIARRRQEQRDAASLGQYSLQIQLGYSSAAVKDPNSDALVTDLVSVLEQCRPEVVYLHNIADAHDTHVHLALQSVAALRKMNSSQHPRQVYGMEVWRSLDWLPEALRLALPLPADCALQSRLLRCHDSQVSGGKHYEEAVLARQKANATFSSSHEVDNCQACALAMDLSPLLEEGAISPQEYLQRCLEEFSASLVALNDPQRTPEP
jgi:LmbE family N-acetylglucosaminyl deacetylase